MKRWKRIWSGALPLFLGFWALMLAVLAVVTIGSQKADMQNQAENARHAVAEQYREVWAGDAAEEKKNYILSWRLTGQLSAGDGIFLSAFYGPDGQLLTRTPMARGCACFPGTGVYSWFFQLDPVLSEDEQLALAGLLRENRDLQQFYGASGGLYEARATGGLYCEVVGVADPALEIVYPQSITYVYEDRSVLILDSDSDFFSGKELTTLRFDAVQLTSALVGAEASPRALLRRWREAESNLEQLLAFSPPQLSRAGSSSNGSQSSSIDGAVVLATAYAYSPLGLAAQSLWLTALLTLAAAAAMAAYTDHKQRQALQRQRDFTRAAAHELKTPLAVLRGHAEALREDIAPDKRAQYLDIVLEESDRMAALVGQLLELSRLDRGDPLRRETFDLGDLVRAVWSPLSLQLARKDLTLELDLPPCTIGGDRDKLREAVENLASNALRHCTPGGQIQVRLTRENGEIRLSVCNDGPAIAPEDLAHLFEPFYRGDRSRSRDQGGTGLGLAIAQAAAQAHGGRCTAENLPNGPSFTILLPDRP